MKKAVSTVQKAMGLSVLYSLFFSTNLFAMNERVDTEVPAPITDSDNFVANSDSIVADSTIYQRPKGLWKKVLYYFRESNKQKTNKKIDFGFVPGPNYSSTTGLGLGFLGTATYSTDRSDPTLQRSNASIYSNMTTKGFFMVGLRGNHIFPHEKFQLDYKVNLSTFSNEYWGIGYVNADNDDNKTDYRRNRINAMARFMIKLAPKTFIGPFVNYRVVQARNIKDEYAYLWQGQSKTARAYTAGVSFTYDSRDFMLNASRGWFMQLDLTTNPTFLGNNNTYWSAELQLATYRKAWRGAIIAGELHTRQSTGQVPWPMLADVGSSNRMRGYYEGRYRDKNVIDAQVELRQHIWHRNGIVLWLGAAEVFPRYSDMRFSRILPNAGVGYRWQFKKGVNVRLDYGFSRNGTGFIFNINEAF